MKAMNPVSARALNGFAAISIMGGLLVGSPSGAFLSFCFAAVLASIPTPRVSIMKPSVEQLRHWLPPVVGGLFILLAGRILFVGLNSPRATLGSAVWPSAGLLVLAFGLFRRANWARLIGAVALFLAGVFCFVLIVSRFFPPGIFGRDGASTVVERPTMVATLAWFLPPAFLLPTIAHLLRPARKQ